MVWWLLDATLLCSASASFKLLCIWCVGLNEKNQWTVTVGYCHTIWFSSFLCIECGMQCISTLWLNLTRQCMCVCVCTCVCRFLLPAFLPLPPAYPPFFSSCPNLLLNKKIIKDMELVYYCDVLWFTPQLDNQIGLCCIFVMRCGRITLTHSYFYQFLI